MKVKLISIGPSHPEFAKTDENFTQVRIVSLGYDGKEFPLMQIFGPCAKRLAFDIICKFGLEIENECK